MEQLLKFGNRLNGKAWIAVFGVFGAVLLVAAVVSISGMPAEQQEELLYTAQDFLPIFMFLALAFFLFSVERWIAHRQPA